MLALHRRIDRTRATRQLDALAVQAAPHMEAQAHRSFLTGLIDRARGTVAQVADTAERMVWNGRVLGTARAIKATAHKMFEKGLVA